MSLRDILNEHADRISKDISDLVYNDDGLQNLMDTYDVEQDVTIDKYAEGNKIIVRLWNGDL